MHASHKKQKKKNEVFFHTLSHLKYTDVMSTLRVLLDEKLYLHAHAFHMRLVRIFGHFDARCRRREIAPVYFKWTFDLDVDVTTPFKKMLGSSFRTFKSPPI